MGATLISHPHMAAVAQGFAAALAARGRLAGFFTGVAFAGDGKTAAVVRQLAGRWPVLQNRLFTGAPGRLLRSLPLVELGARGPPPLLARVGVQVKPYDAIFTAHDAAVSLLPWPRATTAVYAYEDGALLTFRRAERRGLGRIWDLPLPHYQLIEDLHRQEAARWPDGIVGQPHREPEWKKRRKDAELALATCVSVASAFTRRSLESLDVRVPIVVVPYGFPVDEFQPRSQTPAGKFTVLAVGTQDFRKGTPYLLEAWRRAAIPDAELRLVGPMKLAKRFLDDYAGQFVHYPHVPKRDLPAHYQAADLLAFPTLGDGFGLVMQEAMCCGTPVITTECGGGPECVTDGVDGWLVPPRDIDALVERLREAAANRDRTAAMGSAARARAERWTWRETAEALAQALPD